jgi:DNA-binding GntR family transcriptional regulator
MESMRDEEKSVDLMSQRVTEDIRSLILQGDLAPGSRIGQEQLAERFHTSRIPVREALRRLESDGLVILVPNSGAWVAKLDLSECLELYKIRERLEPLALSESVKNMSDEDLGYLDGLVTEMELGVTTDDFLRLDRQFHLASYRASGMLHLNAIIERYWNSTQHYRRAYTKLVGSDNWIIHYEHRLMMAAMKRRDADEAGRLLYGHIRRTRLELDRHREIFHSDGAPAGPKRKRRKINPVS